MSASILRTLYDERPPLRSHRLDVGDGHLLSVREYGHDAGMAAVVLHGGPGSGCSPLLRRFFDPQRYRIVCIDQRGAGDSTPRGAVDANTTAHLLADLRRVRAHLGIARWLVVGGSWGATLALLHALDDSEAVTGVLLRGTWLARRADVAQFFAGARLGDGLDADDLDTRLARLTERLQHGSLEQQRVCALTWWHWEQRMSHADHNGAAATKPPAKATAATPPPVDALVGRYRVQSHYLRHGCWLTPPLLERCASLRVQAMRLLHGESDRICPLEGAQALQRVLPQAALQVVSGAGHDPSHPGMVDAMVGALDAYAAHGRFDAEG